jgi:hypothetical protein
MRHRYAVRVDGALRGGLRTGLLAVLLHVAPAVGGDARPTEADLRACHDLAVERSSPPAYVERTPVSPFPSRISGVGEWTGPVTGVPPPRVTARREQRPKVPVEAPSPTFGAGGKSEEGSSEMGPVEAKYREAFDACLRSLGY